MKTKIFSLATLISTVLAFLFLACNPTSNGCTTGTDTTKCDGMKAMSCIADTWTVTEDCGAVLGQECSMDGGIAHCTTPGDIDPLPDPDMPDTDPECGIGGFKCESNNAYNCVDGKWDVTECLDGQTCVENNTGASCVVECKITDESVTPDPSWTAYGSVKASGVINASDASSPSSATGAAKLVLPNYPNKKLAQIKQFFQDDMLSTTAGEQLPAVTYMALGDPGTKYYGTFFIMATPKDILMQMKTEAFYSVDQGISLIQIYDISELPDDLVKQCVIAVQMSDADVWLGKATVCWDKNVEFAVGETMKLGQVNPLLDDEEQIKEMFGGNNCTCFNATSGQEVTCP